VPFERLLEPLNKLAKGSKVKAVREAAKEALNDERIRKWRGDEVENEDEEMQDGEDEDDEWGGIDD